MEGFMASPCPGFGLSARVLLAPVWQGRVTLMLDMESRQRQPASPCQPKLRHEVVSRRKPQLAGEQNPPLAGSWQGSHLELSLKVETSSSHDIGELRVKYVK